MISVLLLITCLVYFLLIWAFLVGWHQIPIVSGQTQRTYVFSMTGQALSPHPLLTPSPDRSSPVTTSLPHPLTPFPPHPLTKTISVVVAARNETGRICSLLQALRRQEYPADAFEVVVVDDYSDDDTFDIVSRFIDSHRLANFRLISAGERASLQGKKHALDLGIRDARGEIILCTDADCMPGPGWIRAMTDPFADKGLHMVLGPVMLTSDNQGTTSVMGRLFRQLQQLEFISLMAVTAGAAGIGHPVMANGANIAFRKRTWVELQGYTGNTQYISGDDMFLLHNFKKRKHTRIAFCKDTDAMVATPASDSLGAFFRQRGRWAGKATGYKDVFTICTAVVVALLNMLLAASLLYMAAVAILSGFPVLSGVLSQSGILSQPGTLSEFSASLSFVWACGLAWTIKAAADVSLLWPVTRFFGQRKLLWLFLPASLLYPFYISGSMITAILRKNQW